MVATPDTATTALAEVERLRSTLKKKRTKQVYAQDERSLAKATAMAWFRNHRPVLPLALPAGSLTAVDALYRDILDASDRGTARTTYRARLKHLRNALMTLRSDALGAAAASSRTSDQAPDFRPLTTDSNMQAILGERWQECVRCIEAQVPLAATVMMGGLLETLLLGRMNRETNRAPIFTARCAPRDKAGKTLMLQDWGLKDYISVAHELKWISVSAKEVAEVLRDFRNYIHPHKQHMHNVRLTTEDAGLLWNVSKSISVQVLKSCAP
jgi:hypothetical protein